MAAVGTRAKTDAKFIILGAADVGKTSLLQRYLTGQFAQTVSSIGASLALKKWNDYNVAFWDTAGEERYASLSSFYCRGASVAVLSYDITSRVSFNKLSEVFIPLLEEAAPTCLAFVVGTKLDLATTREVKKDEGINLAIKQHEKQLQRAINENSNIYLQNIDGKRLFFETSAKDDIGVAELFEAIQTVVISQLQKGVQPKKTSGIQVDSGPSSRVSNGCCS